STLAALVPPGVALVHNAPFLVRRAGTVADEAYVLGVMSSIPFDWYIRRWVDRHLTFDLLNPAPLPRPDKDNPWRARAAEIAGARPHLAMAWHLVTYDAGRALMEGRVGEAEDRMDEALAVGRRAGHPYAETVHGVQAVELARLRGDPEAVLRLAEGDPWLDLRPTWLEAMAARALLALGRGEEARARFEMLAQRGFDRLRRNVRWTKNLVELAGLCAELRDAPRAAALITLLTPFEHHHAVLPVPICHGGPVSHALARLHEAVGALDLADECYTRAAADAHRLGARPSEARVAIDHALLCARRGDRVGARERRAQALAVARAAGLTALERAAEAQRGIA
ncbi:MAG TPA: hypothetical protein VLC53_00425, partial [Myxococcota bacterium]|nr:hypothetical protein [Myxococcota bacterium]